MSSHHFVREQQEPALFIVEATVKDVVDPLLEWSPTVLVTSQVLDQVLLWGIKVDVVTTEDIDVSILTEKLADFSPVKILPSTEGNIVETALYFLISNKQSAVNIIVRDPTSLIAILQPFTDRLDISLITTETKWSFIRSGNFKKWLPAGNRIKVLGGGSFFQSNLDQTKAGFNVQHDGVTELASSTGFWVGEGL